MSLDLWAAWNRGYAVASLDRPPSVTLTAAALNAEPLDSFETKDSLAEILVQRHVEPVDFVPGHFVGQRTGHARVDIVAVDTSIRRTIDRRTLRFRRPYVASDHERGRLAGR